MNDPLSHEKSARRADLYIEELRELFMSRGMKVGTAEDVLALASCLAVPGPVHDDITSIVRSIIYREHEAIPRPELLRLIVVAVAGYSPVHEPSDPVQPALLQIESYVGEVISSLRRRSFAEDPEEPEASLDEPSGTEPVVASSREPVCLPQETEAEVMHSAARLQPENSAAPTISLSAKAPKAVPLFAEPSPIDTSTPIQQSHHQLLPQPASTLVTAAVQKASPSRRSAWIVGVAAMFLILLASLFSRQKATVQSAVATSSPSLLAPSSPSQPEPALSLPTNTVGHPQAPTPSSLKLKPSAAHQRISPGVSATQSTPSAANSHPSQPVAQASASSSLQVPSPSPATAPRRSGSSARAHTPNLTSAVTAAGKAGSFLVSSGVMDGHLLTTPTTPSYPKMANMTGIEGKVILQAVVSSNGTVVATHVLDGHRLLRGAAAHAVRGWHYRPYLVHGKPTDVATIVIVDFHLPH